MHAYTHTCIHTGSAQRAWSSQQAFMHVCMRECAYIPTYLHTYLSTYVRVLFDELEGQNRRVFICGIHACIHTMYAHECIPSYLPTYIPAYIHTYIDTYIHTYVRMYIRFYSKSWKRRIGVCSSVAFTAECGNVSTKQSSMKVCLWCLYACTCDCD